MSFVTEVVFAHLRLFGWRSEAAFAAVAIDPAD